MKRKTLRLSPDKAILKNHDAYLKSLIGQELKIMHTDTGQEHVGELIACDNWTITLRMNDEIVVVFKHALSTFRPSRPGDIED